MAALFVLPILSAHSAESAKAQQSPVDEVTLVPAKTIPTSPFPGSTDYNNTPTSAQSDLTPEQLQTRAQLANQPPSDSEANVTNYGPGSQDSQSGDNTLPSRDSVNKAVQQMVAVVSPEQLKQIKELQDKMSRANAYAPVSFVPRTSSLSLDLSSGSAIPVVRVAPGQGTYITFEDITGQPWPLTDTPMSADPSYSVIWYKGTNTVYVQPTRAYGNGNIGVVLKDLNTPIQIILANGEPDSPKKSRIYDSRISFRVPLRGPNAKQYSITRINKIGLYDEELQALLDGVPPKEAQKLKSDNAQVSVWRLAGKMYVRTPLESKSMFSKTLSSSDGTHVYEMEITPFITLSDGMNTVSVKVDL